MSEQTNDLDLHAEGATLRDAAVWQDARPDDADVQQAAEDIKATLDRWRLGELDSTRALDELYDHCFRTEGDVSEDASAMYIQAATLGFGTEADISYEDDQTVHGQVRARYGYEDL